ncbi:hypothetical protein AUG19_07920 [archaeon 13_1_20CM_2_54_9]|nr:MAG: hypothetical protein AUJ07_10250 [Crenarchaeota archaeon 13_1_40CM_3_53_5]OLE74841.1 MAG: hypothetical protein AUG19_07920 [archaeon 13_1_20CM_2_54_9]
MPILSFSVPEQMVEAMDEIQKTRGFSGRSELVRASIRLMFEDTKEKNSLKGPKNAILVVTHNEDNEESVTRLKHRFEEIVRTHIHNKITRNNCVELFLLEGDGPRVAAMTEAFQKDDGMKSVKLLTI